MVRLSSRGHHLRHGHPVICHLQREKAGVAHLPSDLIPQALQLHQAGLEWHADLFGGVPDQQALAEIGLGLQRIDDVICGFWLGAGAVGGALRVAEHKAVHHRGLVRLRGDAGVDDVGDGAWVGPGREEDLLELQHLNGLQLVLLGQQGFGFVDDLRGAHKRRVDLIGSGARRFMGRAHVGGASPSGFSVYRV